MNKTFILIFVTASHLVSAQTEFGFIGSIHAADQRVSYDRSMRISTNGPFTFDVKSSPTLEFFSNVPESI
ncbi:MAG: hypothetical protein KF763_15585 [Cyclobacteriaceae bacterium]|nr:hypothetical protein [Cyclobacteriaceae bacterium]